MDDHYRAVLTQAAPGRGVRARPRLHDRATPPYAFLRCAHAEASATPIIGSMSLRVGELPRVPVVGVRVRPAAVARFVGFGVAAHLAGDIGRLSHDADLGVSMVWPLYGVAVLWMATGDRRTWPWDVLGLVVATVSSLVVSDGTPGEIVVAVFLAVVARRCLGRGDAAAGARLVGTGWRAAR